MIKPGPAETCDPETCKSVVFSRRASRLSWLSGPVVVFLFCGSVAAQSIDAERSRFLSSPNGRAGTYAPFRLVVSGLQGVDTLNVRSVCQDVVLTRQVAVVGQDRVEVVLPVMVGEGARVEAGEAVLTPALPLRRIEPDYARPYVAVFSADPVYARGVLPSSPVGAICDYYELREFFTDWRLLDGYDAIVIFNPAEVRLPEGSQRAIAEFCSLGGATLVAGSFRLGEKAEDLPAPAEPIVQLHHGVAVQRFGYGPGAIYRVSADDLRRSASAHEVIVGALRDHFWFGAEQPPAGKPASRVAPLRTPLPPPLPPTDASPGPMFWGLAGGLLLACGLIPLVTSRYTRLTWRTQVNLALCCGAIGIVASTQARPLPAVEISAIVTSGEGEAASTRVFVHARAAWNGIPEINLDDAEARELYRATPAAPGWNAWISDSPLTAAPVDSARASNLVSGSVGDLSFRDFGTAAHRGSTQFSTDDAWLVDWWLEGNAYRGRAAELAPVESPFATSDWGESRLVLRGAIRLTPKRARD